MPVDLIKFSYSAGELSEDLHGRGDLEGFHFGYRKGLNVFVDWRGGVKTRPGTLMCEPVFENPDEQSGYSAFRTFLSTLILKITIC